MVLVGKKAPSFQASAVVNGSEIVNDFSLVQYIGSKYVVFFFYPADFTFVCPTELHAFQQRMSDFEARDTVIVACSVDSEFSHWKWLQIDPADGGIKGVTYPIVSDQSLLISQQYDVFAGQFDYDENDELILRGVSQAYRGLFLIDKEGVVRYQVVNDMPLGRSVEETLRMVDALQFFEKHGEVCPANWHAGEKGMAPTAEGVSKYLSEQQK